ncbi:MAG: hypothetical protein B5M53_09390 [Candidatus Cloacimonas sp. 4484_209]|nr:MAG: hypothetical protein B5M53_09390 [Candidatus Cloacimonas sp. 4484_209]
MIFLNLTYACPDASEQLLFANYLYNQGDYFRAITEYKRFIFISKDLDKKWFARKRILVSYKKAGRYDDALYYLLSFNDSKFSNIEKGKIYLLMGNTKKARSFFLRSNSDTSKILKSWSFTKEAKWENSINALAGMKKEALLSKTADSLRQFLLNADKKIEKKDILTAAFLSVIVPGTGRFYSGRVGDGFYSFLTVAVPGVISYYYWKKERKTAFRVSLGFSIAFYIGDIYGSIISAKLFNYNSKRLYIEGIDNTLHIQDRFIKQ